MTLYIVIHHLRLYEKNIGLYFLFGQGQFIVVVFWILSGFTTSMHYSSGIDSSFLFNRFYKLLPIFICSLFLTYLIESVSVGHFSQFDAKIFFGNLLQLQDLNRHKGAYIEVYKSNTPLWFVSYLIWFYVIFYIFRKYLLKPSYKFSILIGLGAFSLFLIYPNPLCHFAWYFPIWYAGYLLHLKIPLKKILGMLSISASTALLCLSFNPYTYTYFPFLEMRHFFYAIVGISGIFFIQERKFFLNKENLFFSFFNYISYPLFLVHYPLMIYYNPFQFTSSSINVLLGFLLSILVSTILAFLNDQFLKTQINKPA